MRNLSKAAGGSTRMLRNKHLAPLFEDAFIPLLLLAAAAIFSRILPHFVAGLAQ